MFEDVEFAKTVSFEGSTFNSGTIRNKTITFKNVKFNKDIDLVDFCKEIDKLMLNLR